MTSPINVVKSVGPKLVPFFKSVAVYLVLLPEGGSLFTAAVKCAPVLSLILFVLLHGVGHDDQYTFSRRILLGLCCSCVGDALLVWPHQFVSGMAAFGLAHVAYIAAFGLAPLRPVLGAFLFFVTAVVCRTLMPGVPGALVLALPVYSVLLAAMAWRAMARLRARAAWRWTELCSSVGGVFFVLSDGLIGVHEFYEPVKNAQVLIMSTYYFAQLCIALSVVDSVSEYQTQARIRQQTGRSGHTASSKTSLNAT